MSKQAKIAALIAFATGFVAVVFLPGDWLFVPPPAAHDHSAEMEEERYACPMLCVIRSTPGTCPVCQMTMEKIEVGSETLELSKYERRMIGLATAEAEFKTLYRSLRSVGRIEHDETRVREVAAWMDGRIDRLFADYTGVQVKQGDPLFEIYSPLLYESQQSFVSALDARDQAGDSKRALELAERNVDSMRKRLLLLGLTVEQVSAVEESRQPRTHLVVAAPVSGTVIDKRVVEGQYVKEGETLAVVSDLSRLWIQIDVFEEDVPWIRRDLEVEVSSRAFPAEVLTGKITFIDPVLDRASRSVEARVEVENDHGRLRPGMFAEVRVKVPLDFHGRPHLVEDEELPKVLAVPEEAVLVSGRRHLVYVMTSPPRFVDDEHGVPREVKSAAFAGREVAVGPLADEGWPILSGLRPGEHVATRGNFLIDSQMQLSGMSSLIGKAGAAADPHAGH